MKTLFLGWQAPESRQWFPVGRLDADADADVDAGRDRFSFRYTQGAIAARGHGFYPMPSFPDFLGDYRSADLFPMFRNRILAPRRKDYREYLHTLGLNRDDPIEILAVTGGARQTDSFELFPKIEKQSDGSFRCRFFLHGLRHVSGSAQQRAAELQTDEALGVSVELTNPVTQVAIQLTTRDYHLVGWAPRYLVSDLMHSLADVSRIHARVVKVNGAEVPPNRRVLIEFCGHLPVDAEPMSSEEFQVLA